MQRTTFGRACLGIFFVAALLVSVSGGQRHSTYPTPPAPAVPSEPASSERKYVRRPLDTVAMEREAKELDTLAGSIPGDVEQLKKGLLPSDTFEKLKRIEKLSKQLRSQMQP